jgi:hypothetical protein
VLVEGKRVVFLLRKFSLAVAILVGLAGPVLAQFPVPMTRPSEDMQPSQVRELVSKYCRLDYEGARLDSEQWTKLAPLVWWHASPDFNQVNVISRYTVDPEPVSSHGKYTVTVHYRLLGTFDLVNGYVPELEVANQDVDFILSSENTEWRIAEADNTLPHPSRTAMLKWLNAKLTTIQDERMKARYQDAIDQMQKQSASPFAK